MIPKIIHYCWLSGDKLPLAFQKNLDDWKKLLPDYEFILWDFTRFHPDDHKCGQWVKECFERKRYAWASDPIRLTALYEYGGIYMDLDVELLKPWDELLSSDYVLGYEYTGKIEAGIMGVSPRQRWIKECLKKYDDRSCLLSDGTFDANPLPNKITDSLIESGFVLHRRETLCPTIYNDKDMYILAPIYLSAKNSFEVFANDQTFSVHHFAASSARKAWKFKMFIIDLLGARITRGIVRLKKELLSVFK